MNVLAEQALERARVKISRRKSSRRYWTNREMELLSALYPDHPGSAVAERLDRPLSAVHAKAKAMGIKKSDAFLNGPHSGRLDGLRGAASRFQKGGRSWNKDKPMPSTGRSSETQFSKGAMPHNHLPVGSEVMSTDGYLKIKVAEPNTWEWTHRRNWEAEHGAIPDGMVLVFKTADRMDCSVENLELITRQELMGRNTIQRFPPELKQTMRLLSKLNRAIEANIQ